MKPAIALSVLLAAAVSPAFAQDCEDQVRKTGNVFTGSQYEASTLVPDASVASAIGQMKAVALAKGMVVLDESPEAGSLLVEQPATMAHKPLPMAVSARGEGPSTRVAITLKLRAGSIAASKSIGRELCAMLAAVRSGKAREAAAAAAATSELPPVEMLATLFADQIDQEAEDNATLIEPRRKGRTYRLKGWTGTIVGEKGRYAISFDMDPGLFVVPGARPRTLFSTAVLCRMAADQNAYAMTLRAGDRIVLTGTFDYYDSSHRVAGLRDCRPG